ncbi:LysR family transcriptional regulator [Oleiphilus messinensis]|uniref:LysR family transcriptional regulator n=1 Tax=Oleiphilus messinensis TaxID=141451 RepID=A0A1Y0IAK3_9GAMM|nr:LysR family transcriptional regulator [Oleiphilus messinensis]ARU56454.1 LysR family transcriptional regulator [Oleiphilus messinensis]
MKNQELTLLYIFDAIMTEGSITRAADRLAMTQPAVSNAVSRMRQVWNDPLFVKKGRLIEPTSFARSLWDQVRDPMHDLSHAVSSSHFDPIDSKRKFRIAVADVMVELIWQPLACQLEKLAPGVDLHAVPYTAESAYEQLREAHVDLAIGKLNGHDHSLRSIWLFDGEYVLAMGAHHPLAGKQISLEQFTGERHLLVSLSGHPSGIIDQVLQQQGLKRRVAVTVNHFPAVPNLLRNSNMIAVLPKFAVGNPAFDESIWLTDVPLELDPISVYLFWHTRHDRDPGLIWMRQLVEQITKDRWSLCKHCTADATQLYRRCDT